MTHSHPLPLKQIPYQHPELSASVVPAEEAGGLQRSGQSGEVLD